MQPEVFTVILEEIINGNGKSPKVDSTSQKFVSSIFIMLPKEST